jgi:DnaJ homolog subfamily C member 28
MDFVDYRKIKDQHALEEAGVSQKEQQSGNRLRGRHYHGYVEEMINEAQRRGDFDNLEGMGKPFQFGKQEDKGENAMAYRLLKSNGYVPPEIELAKLIDTELAHANVLVERMYHQYRTLHNRRIAPFEREKRSFNATVEKTATAYAEALRRINSKILTLNITAPGSMHRPLLDVDNLINQFRSQCPLFSL